MKSISETLDSSHHDSGKIPTPRDLIASELAIAAQIADSVIARCTALPADASRLRLADAQIRWATEIIAAQESKSPSGLACVLSTAVAAVEDLVTHHGAAGSHITHLAHAARLIALARDQVRG